MSQIISDKGIEWLHNEIETLRAANKDLQGIVMKYCEVQQSRDELLEACIRIEEWQNFQPSNAADEAFKSLPFIIQRAKALKKKETKC